MKVLRLPQVMEKTGLGHTVIYEMIAAGTFPNRFTLHNRAVGWLEHEVDEWIQKKVDEHRGTDGNLEQ